MGLTGIALVLVSLAFFGNAAAHDCQNGTETYQSTKRIEERLRYFYCVGNETNLITSNRTLIFYLPTGTVSKVNNVNLLNET
uniref:Putative basic tail protein n=1 Tax=Ixodes ricinus TaxID=34613 RepID=A0A0K8RGB7_IXORI